MEGADWRPVRKKPKLTAGLKWAPDTAMRAEIMTARASPWATATASRPLAPVSCWAQIAPCPMKHKANVPVNSAAYTFIPFSMASSARRGGPSPAAGPATGLVRGCLPQPHRAARPQPIDR